MSTRLVMSYATVSAVVLSTGYALLPAHNASAQTLGAQARSAQALSAQAVYERVASAWASQSTLDARFEQRIANPILGRTVSSKGVFLQQRPGKVAITFTEPAGDRIVSDGKTLWVYLPSSTPGQVLKLAPLPAEL